MARAWAATMVRSIKPVEGLEKSPLHIQKNCSMLSLKLLNAPINTHSADRIRHPKLPPAGFRCRANCG
jgi:hypothetical protein